MDDFKLKTFDLKYLRIENILSHKDAKFEFNSIEIANVVHKKFRNNSHDFDKNTRCTVLTFPQVEVH